MRTEGRVLTLGQENFLNMPDVKVCCVVSNVDEARGRMRMDMYLQEGQTFECPLCLSEYTIDNVLILSCKHVFCVGCMLAMVEQGVKDASM